MPDPDTIDPGRPHDRNAFDQDDGEGQQYHRDREAAMGEDLPSGTVAAKPDAPHPAADPAIPSENGRRASFDPKTGEVHGSGSGAGGGNPGEDFDSDPMTGDGYPITGSEGLAKGGSTDLGPTHFKQ